MYFKIKPEWKGRTVVIIASGPSVTQRDIDYIRRARDADKCRVIAINAMYQHVDFADALYFCDWKFYRWHAIDDRNPVFLDYPAPKYTITETPHIPAHIRRLRKASADGYGLCREPDAVEHGSNSGYQCLNLAFHYGASRIIMVGYDMKHGPAGEIHCHEEHRVPTMPEAMGNILKGGYFESIAPELFREGVEVINTSMDSALHCFTKIPLREILL